MSELKYTASLEECQTIAAIATRYWEMCIENNRTPLVTRQTLIMDIEVAHCNGCPLRLKELLQASGGDFLHDVNGIVMNIDRTTGKLAGIFCPRYAV